jgi:hypothetical protein
MPNSPIRRRVVVKFQDTSNIPYEDGAERHVERLRIGSWTVLTNRFQGARLNRLFTAMPPARISELVAKVARRSDRDRPASLLSYFVVETPAGSDPGALAAALRAWPQVEEAYIDPLDSAPAWPSGTNPSMPGQTYLKPPATAAPPAPQGAIDAEFAWLLPGGTGVGQKIVDLERGAELGQDDLVGRSITRLAGVDNLDPTDRRHGAQVLCVVAAMDNNTGIVGIAYGLQEVKYTCQVLQNPSKASPVNRPDAVLAAINYLTQSGEDPVGRVLLLEVQLGSQNDSDSLEDVNGVFWEGMPMETTSADYAAISTARDLGIVVIEAAGNGDNNLDQFQQKISGQFVLARTGGRADSGAIMVGGSTSNFPYRRKVINAGFQGSCFGSRVDCFAWSENVMTYQATRSGEDLYSADFDGTSAAAAIVAGAALLVEGAVQAKTGSRLGPAALRALLADTAPNGNTPSHNPPVDQIGVMPNLRYILQTKLGIGVPQGVPPPSPSGLAVR